jgi:hypothetical protein
MRYTFCNLYTVPDDPHVLPPTPLLRYKPESQREQAALSKAEVVDEHQYQVGGGGADRWSWIGHGR